MEKVFKVVRRKDAQLSYPSGTSTGNSLHRIIDEKNSDQMGGGYFSINGVTETLVLPYDELAICLEGVLELTVDGVMHKLDPGDFAWMPKGTEVAFGGSQMTAFYGVHPVDWRSQNT